MVSSDADDLAGPNARRDGVRGPRQGHLGARQHVEDGALADGETEHSAISRDRRSKPIACDVKVGYERHDARTEGAARRQIYGRWRAEGPATARTTAAVTQNTGHHGLDWRQVDVIIGVDIGLGPGRQGMIAVRAGIC